MNSSRLESQSLIHLDRLKLVKTLGWILFGLALAHSIVLGYSHFVRELPWLFTDLFDLDEEQSFATWFSTMILAIAAVLLFAAARMARRNRHPFGVHWYGLAFGFAFLSMDELVGLHETLNTLIDMPWSIPGAVLVAVVGLAYLGFLLHLRPRTRRLFLWAGLAYTGGAVGIELVGHSYSKAVGIDNFGYQSLVLLEEMLEMSGVVILIHALMDHLSDEGRRSIHLAGFGCAPITAEPRARGLYEVGFQPETNERPEPVTSTRT